MDKTDRWLLACYVPLDVAPVVFQSSISIVSFSVCTCIGWRHLRNLSLSDVHTCGRVEALETYIKAYLGTEVALDDLKAMLCFDKRKQCFRWLQDQVTLN